MTQGLTSKFQIKKPLKDIFEEIKDPRFIFIDRSCFVNLDHVVRITDNEVYLQDDHILPVSRRMVPIVKTALLKLWGELN